MRKTILLVTFASAIAVATTSCGIIGRGAAVYGGIYTQVKEPGMLNMNEVGTKVGTSEALGVLGIVGVGDYGLDKAIQKGNIKRVSHVDFEVFSILGLFTKVTTYVYGN